MGKKKRKKEWVWQNKTKKKKERKGTENTLLCMSFNVKMKRHERKRWKKIMLKNDFFNYFIFCKL